MGATYRESLGGIAADADVDNLPMITFLRMTKLGLFCGMGYGLLQDGMKLLQGQRVGYVDALMGRGRRFKPSVLQDGIGP